MISIAIFSASSPSIAGARPGVTTPSRRENARSQLGMIASLGKMEEFATHVRGALVNGLTPDESARCSCRSRSTADSVGVDCFRIAKTVLGEGKKA